MRPFCLKNRRFVGNRVTGAHKAKKVRMLLPRFLWHLMMSKMAAVAALVLWFNSFFILNSSSSSGPDQIGVRVWFLIAKRIRKSLCVFNFFFFKVFSCTIHIWLVTSLGKIRSNSLLLFDQRYELLKPKIKVFLWTIPLKTPKSEWWKLNPS